MQSFGSLDDSARGTVLGAQPGTFRTNFGLLEVTGNSVRVRVTLRFSYPAGTKLPLAGSASKDYTLNPNQFLLLSGIAAEILGASRDTLGDLHGLEADFQVLDGNGAVALFTSSVDNGTGDSILRTEKITAARRPPSGRPLSANVISSNLQSPPERILLHGSVLECKTH